MPLPTSVSDKTFGPEVLGASTPVLVEFTGRQAPVNGSLDVVNDLQRRVKIARVIRDLYLTDWGARLFMFENFNGTPLQTLLSLTMKRAEFTGSGPFASFARQVCGIEAKTATTEYQATADYAKAQDTGRRTVNIQAAE